MADRIRVRTTTRNVLVDITDQIADYLRDHPVANGTLTLWSLHTTCALTVNEGADPDVSRDMVKTMRRLIPEKGDYRHSEGNSDSHIKTSLFGPGLTLMIEDGDLVLGTWQHVFLAEWDGPRQRQIAYQIIAAV